MEYLNNPNHLVIEMSVKTKELSKNSLEIGKNSITIDSQEIQSSIFKEYEDIDEKADEA